MSLSGRFPALLTDWFSRVHERSGAMCCCLLGSYFWDENNKKYLFTKLLVSQVSTPVSRSLSQWAGVSAVPLSPWVEGCVAPPCPWEGVCVAPLSPQDSFQPTSPHSHFRQSTLSQTHRYWRKREFRLFRGWKALYSVSAVCLAQRPRQFSAFCGCEAFCDFV